MPYKNREAALEYFKRYNKAHYNSAATRARVKTRQQALLNWLRDLKVAIGCRDCPERHPACLDFHHRDPNEKDVGLAETIRAGWGKKRLLQEIAKCDVLCANCHRKQHWELTGA